MTHLLSFLGVLPGTASAEAEKEDDDSSWGSKVPSLREAVGSLWLTCFWTPSSLMLLLPQPPYLHLNQLLLQGVFSVRTGTKWGPAKVWGFTVTDCRAGFLGQRSNSSFCLQSSEVLEGWHCENCFFPPFKSLLWIVSVKWLCLTHNLGFYFFGLCSLLLGQGDFISFQKPCSTVNGSTLPMFALFVLFIILSFSLGVLAESEALSMAMGAETTCATSYVCFLNHTAFFCSSGKSVCWWVASCCRAQRRGCALCSSGEQQR